MQRVEHLDRRQQLPRGQVSDLIGGHPEEAEPGIPEPFRGSGEVTKVLVDSSPEKPGLEVEFGGDGGAGGPASSSSMLSVS